MLENDTGRDGANHAMQGIYILAVPPATEGRGRRSASLYDIAPTLGDLLGLTFPDGGRGKSLLGRVQA